MSTSTASRRPPSGAAPRQGKLAHRRPVAAFLLLAFGTGWPALAVPALAGTDTGPFLLFLVFVPLLGSALLVTWVTDGPGAVRSLLSRTVQWRFGPGRWAVIALGVPVLTVLIAAASGTLVSPSAGWLAEVGSYLFATFVFGALVLNVWEEAAWGGFAQSRLMARHGLLVSSLVTAVFFAGIHVPLYLSWGLEGRELGISLAVLFAIAPVYRYLLGMHLLDTGGSILAIGVQHASWNAAQSLGVVDGGEWHWQALSATVLLTVLVAAGRRVRSGSVPTGRSAEQVAAARWIAAPQPDRREGS
jgi:membrane protease YdiL (CAAX protease family)